MAQRETPLFDSQYRWLCFQLELLFRMCSLSSNSFTNFQPYILDPFHRSSRSKERWLCHRWSHSLHADGVQSTAVIITADEYDRGLALHSDALGVFLECDLSGAELHSADNLQQQEDLARMQMTARGRAKLDALAAKVVEVFGLDSEEAEQQRQDKVTVTGRAGPGSQLERLARAKAARGPT